MVDDPELEPDAARADGDGLVGELSPAGSERRNTSTTSMPKGTSARVAYPCSPSTVGASGCTGTIRLPCSCRNRAIR